MIAAVLFGSLLVLSVLIETIITRVGRSARGGSNDDWGGEGGE